MERANRTPRQVAIAAGETRYQGRPCRRCGGTERRTINGGCVACRRVENLSPEQIGRKRASDRATTMSPERIERKRARDRIENMAPEKIERKRARNRIENMTEEQVERKRTGDRERYRNLSDFQYNRLLLRNRRRKALARTAERSARREG
jgi:hypothetical protein